MNPNRYASRYAAIIDKAIDSSVSLGLKTIDSSVSFGAPGVTAVLLSLRVDAVLLSLQV